MQWARKRDSIMSGRKTTFEERLSIIEDLIKHDVNYNWTVENYNVSYQQVYGWYQKYRKSGNDPQSLRDRRGKAKPQKERTLGYLGMTTQLVFENKLNFKAGLKRVTNCMRNHGIRANIRKRNIVELNAMRSI